MRISLALVLLFAACGPQEQSPFVGRPSADLVAANGENLNGENLNGENLNGENLNGENLNGPGLGANVAYASFAGAALADGTPLQSAWLAGTVFHGIASGRSYAGVDFDGATFAGVMLDGSPIPLRVHDLSQAAAPNDDVWSVFADYLDRQGVWQPLCQDASGRAVAAIPLRGRWSYARGIAGGGSKIDDPGAFTLACKGLGAIAKCVLPIGYKPWASAGGVSLEPLHEACVRLLRADYCGDGTPWTKNGRLVDLYDGQGIQNDDRPWWFFEAEWTNGGARCVSLQRVIDLKNLLGVVPSCILSRLSLTCGQRSHFSSGTLLMNRFQSPYIGLF